MNDVFWYDQQEPRAPRELRGDIGADVVIVGGGVTGLSCAQRLLEAGMKGLLAWADHLVLTQKPSPVFREMIERGGIPVLDLAQSVTGVTVDTVVSS